jgi:hypothetical protein
MGFIVWRAFEYGRLSVTYRINNLSVVQDFCKLERKRRY